MKNLEKQLLRTGSSLLRRLLRKRPGLGFLLIAAALVLVYFWPDRFEPPRAEKIPAANSGVVSGRVTGVVDGDGLTLDTADGRLLVRLFGLDAPEMRQAGGREARRFLARLVEGREARVEIRGRDQYGRTLGRVFVGGLAVDREMTAAGWAWVYESYCRETFCEELRRLQAEARSGRRGLWRERSPRPPWLWRRDHPRR